jgi:hypothetical protein
VEKHRLHGLACKPGSNDAQYDSAGEKAQGEIKKLAADVARLRPKAMRRPISRRRCATA